MVNSNEIFQQLVDKNILKCDINKKGEREMARKIIEFKNKSFNYKIGDFIEVDSSQEQVVIEEMIEDYFNDRQIIEIYNQEEHIASVRIYETTLVIYE